MGVHSFPANLDACFCHLYSYMFSFIWRLFLFFSVIPPYHYSNITLTLLLWFCLGFGDFFFGRECVCVFVSFVCLVLWRFLVLFYFFPLLCLFSSCCFVTMALSYHLVSGGTQYCAASCPFVLTYTFTVLPSREGILNQLYYWEKL